MRETAPLWEALVEIDRRAGSLAPLIPLLSVSKTRGIVRYEELFPDRLVRAEDLSNYKLVEPGEIVLNKMSAATGAVGRASERGLVSPDYAVLRVASSSDSSYLSYLLSSDGFCKNEVEPRLQGIGVGDVSNARTPRVTMTSYLNPVVFLPPLSTQQRIADFLDRETGEIDAMIAKMDELVETLTTRRQATISNLVNRGAHERPFLTCLSNSVDYRGATPTKTDEGIQLVTARNVKSGWIDYDTSREYVAEDQYEQVMKRGLPQTGDLLFTMEAPLGNIAMITRTNIALAQRIVKWTVDPSAAVPKFFMYAVLGDTFQAALRVRATGSTALGIMASKFAELRIALPPIAEQKRIADHLDDVTSRIDQMLAKVAELKSLLTERRAALITDVVTGRKEVA